MIIEVLLLDGPAEGSRLQLPEETRSIDLSRYGGTSSTYAIYRLGARHFGAVGEVERVSSSVTMLAFEYYEGAMKECQAALGPRAIPATICDFALYSPERKEYTFGWRALAWARDPSAISSD